MAVLSWLSQILPKINITLCQHRSALYQVPNQSLVKPFVPLAQQEKAPNLEIKLIIYTETLFRKIVIKSLNINTIYILKVSRKSQNFWQK